VDLIAVVVGRRIGWQNGWPPGRFTPRILRRDPAYADRAMSAIRANCG
jgi:hypothetical protein